ncbi:PTS sugar transporter subunit IIA [Eremococcus coleocola]|uniref:PTS system, glucose subfamily, IIA component n=1 Tax=Eremococcus coleocola ACS-139-V-Col8 TaxID=908337 RepID=E4KLN4_9LACT|nr:PTS glucose transporter subunit IIA [Eremococcus coleocola]EFR32106.1 PTS system, glucose subfamily, IIA component [Eremococcus coleocola ACS-139-V-Col8]
MGFFDFLKGNKENTQNQVLEFKVYSPLKGKHVALSDVSDAAFSSGALGNGLAIIPEEGKLFAPVDGTIMTLFPTGHAVGIKSAEGAEILIHIGMDTVTLDGDGFNILAAADQTVKKGDLLIEFDIQKIQAAGLEIITPVVITNSGDYASVTDVASEIVTPGDEIIQVNK